MNSSSNNSNIPDVKYDADDGSIDEDWEEWDGRSPFWAHCVAGSLAGVTEHAAVYPLDTVRTHIQCAGCVVPKSSSSTSSAHKFAITGESSTSTLLRSNASHHPPRLPLGMWQTIRNLVSEPTIAATASTALPPHHQIPSTTSTTPSSVNYAKAAGWTRLFRGVQTMLVGCIPAHALYFSSYEITKAAFTDETTGQVSTVGSSLAGAAAVTAHDFIMTPLDTLKQRLQLGHYAGVQEAFKKVYQQEGIIALYRSFPITLLSNVPYGMIMVSTHEACKKVFREQDEGHRPAWQIVLAASSVAGFVASAATTPLDRIKTALQTQQLAPVCPKQKTSVGGSAFCPLQGGARLKHVNWQQAAQTIFKEEGAAGFVRGLTPRVLSHTPAVAISWTTYETAKQYLLQKI